MVVATAILLLHLSVSLASPPSLGRASVTISEPIESGESWNLEIWAYCTRDFEDGKLMLRIQDVDAMTSEEELLWEGAGKGRDTLFMNHTVPSPPNGKYMLSVTLIPFPKMEKGYSGASLDIVYVDVDEDETLYSRASFRGIEVQRILREARERGLGDTTVDGLDRSAPDLAERLRNLTVRVAPSQVKEQQDSGQTESSDVDKAKPRKSLINFAPTHQGDSVRPVPPGPGHREDHPPPN